MNGFTEEQTLEIRGGAASFDSKLDALVKFAAEATIKKGKVSEATLNNFFNTGYTKASVVDVIIAIADKVVMNYLHNLTQVPIDFPVAKPLEIEIAAV
jgi:alkylhydroperoxidase family enzyme